MRVRIWTRRVAISGVLLLAAGVRLWDITHYPPGLYPDQAANGEDALEILHGRLPAFSPRNNGREALFFYVQAATIGLFGVGVWQMFLASAVVGMATVGVSYLAGARLLGWKVGMIGALVFATNPWHVTLSRTGFRAVAVPLFLMLTLWFVARVLRPPARGWRPADAVLAGVSAALGLYTYTAYRAFLVFLILFVVGAVIRATWLKSFRVQCRKLVAPAGIACVTGIMVALPLASFLVRHPEFLSTRLHHVSIFNPDLNHGKPLQTFLSVTGRTLLAFLWNGDGNPRHNVPFPTVAYQPGGRHDYEGGGAPFLSPLPALLAIIGIGVAARRAKWVLFLFGIMLLPAITTAEGIPHGLRTLGTIPAAVWLSGMGASVLADAAVRRWPRKRASLCLVGVMAFALTASLDVWLYFGLARHAPLAHYEYRGDLTTVSRYLNEQFFEQAQRRDPGSPLRSSVPYLVLDDFSVQTVHFLTSRAGHPYRLVRPEVSQEVLMRAGQEMVFTASTLPDAERYQRTHREVLTVRNDRNRFGERILVVLRQP